MKTLSCLSVLVGAFLAAFAAGAAEQTAKLIGDKAPLFEGQDQDGKAWKLSDRAGKKAVLLYFYPKDDTPGCTKEACGFRDRMGDLARENVEVVGVSFDSSESHRKFIQKHNLNFTLLADTDGKIADKYGARMPERPMARRVSFLIGADGRIKHITDDRSADKHLAEMQEAVGRLKKT
jgi:peroxiredoxin Q/BCP